MHAAVDVHGPNLGGIEHGLIQLQQSVGNAAVGELLDRTTVHRQTMPVQRQDDGSGSSEGTGPGVRPSDSRPATRYRVRVVGHASPRWRRPGASTAEALNLDLSMRRALAVEAEVRRFFASRGVPTEFDTTCEVDDVGDDSLAVGWEGSGATLGEAGGDRDSNDPILRRVDVEVEALQAATEMGGYTEALPLPAATTRWAINVDIVEGAQGLAGTWGKGMLRNRDTGQTVRGGWIAGGGGGGIDIPVPSVAPGSWTDFETTNPVSFAAFEGSPIRLTSIAVGIGIGYGTAEFRFTDYMDDSVTISGIAFNQWGAGGSVTAGPWSFEGAIPAPPVVGVERPEEYETTAGSSHGLRILFATESAAIPADEMGQLEQLIAALP